MQRAVRDNPLYCVSIAARIGVQGEPSRASKEKSRRAAPPRGVSVTIATAADAATYRKPSPATGGRNAARFSLTDLSRFRDGY